MVGFADFNRGPRGTPMTETSMPLIDLLRKQDDGDFLRAVGEAVLQLLMEHDVEGLVGGRPLRARGRSPDLAQWLSRPRAEDTPRRVEPTGPEAAAGLMLSRLAGAAPDVGEGAGGGHAGGVDRRRVHPPS